MGATVSFPNGDPLFHNVFSYSRAKRFDLGRYPKGESKTVVFDKPGYVKVLCEVHKWMRAGILVVENPYHAVVQESGRFQFDEVPAGTVSRRGGNVRSARAGRRADSRGWHGDRDPRAVNAPPTTRRATLGDMLRRPLRDVSFRVRLLAALVGSVGLLGLSGLLVVGYQTQRQVSWVVQHRAEQTRRALAEVERLRRAELERLVLRVSSSIRIVAALDSAVNGGDIE